MCLLLLLIALHTKDITDTQMSLVMTLRGLKEDNRKCDKLTGYEMSLVKKKTSGKPQSSAGNWDSQTH